MRQLDTLLRVTETLKDSVDESRLVHDLLVKHHAALADTRWVTQLPVEDEFWADEIVTSLTGLALTDADAMAYFNTLRRFELLLMRLSQWLQIAYGKNAPAGDVAVATPLAETPSRDRAENRRLLAIAAIDDAPVIQRTRPVRIILAAGDQCNYRCRTCYQSLHQDFSYNDVSWIPLDALRETFELASIVHVGGFGEPLMSNATPAILAAAAAAGAMTGLTTNGSLLQRLAGLPMIDWLEISLDGASKEILETVRKGSQLDVIVRGIEGLSVEQRRHTCFNVIITKLNVSEVGAIAVLARDLGVGEVALQSFESYLPWHGDMVMTMADAEEYERQVQAARWIAPDVSIRDVVVRPTANSGTAREKEKVLAAIGAIPPPRTIEVSAGKRLLTELEEFDAASLGGNGAAFVAAVEPLVAPFFAGSSNGEHELPFCLEPYGTMVINADGVVNPCCKLPWNMGNLNEKTVGEVWSGAQYRTLRTAHRTRRNMPSFCVTCKDPNRYAHLSGLVEAWANDGHDLGRVSIPPDYEIPPSVAASLEATLATARARPPQPPPPPPAQPSSVPTVPKRRRAKADTNGAQPPVRRRKPNPAL